MWLSVTAADAQQVCCTMTPYGSHETSVVPSPSPGLLHRTHEGMSHPESSELQRMRPLQQKQNILYRRRLRSRTRRAWFRAPPQGSSTELMNACYTLNPVSSNGCHRHVAVGHCSRRTTILLHNDALGVARDERGSEPLPGTPPQNS